MAHLCPSCSGNGKIIQDCGILEVKENGDVNIVARDVSKVNCPTCKGSGEITKETEERIEEAHARVRESASENTKRAWN